MNRAWIDHYLKPSVPNSTISNTLVINGLDYDVYLLLWMLYCLDVGFFLLDYCSLLEGTYL